MSSSEADVFEEEEEQSQSSAPAPVSPNPNLQASQSDTMSPSVSISSVEGSQASESEDSDYREVLAAGFPRFTRWLNTLRSMEATTNSRPRRSASSTPPTPSPRLTSSSSSDMEYPVPVFNGTRAPVRFRRSNRDLLTRRISTFMTDEGENPPRPRFRNRHLQARAMAQYRASAQARRMRAGVGVLTEEELRSMERLPAGAFAQIPRRGNSMSDCSQCSSDEEGNKAKPKNTKSKIPPISSHLAEWLYPV